MTRNRDVANVLTAASNLATDTETAAAISTHAALSDPHSVYLKESEYTAAGKNYLINGAFDFWQRGTTFSVAGYTADRWNVDSGTTTRQTGTGQFPYCLQIANASGNPALRQGFELPFAGNAGQFQVGTTWTASFYAKTSTSIGSQLAFYVAFNDGVNTGSNAVQIASSTTVGASSTSWTKYTYTFTVASSPAVTNTAVMVVPYLNSGAYAGNFSIAQVQLELGSSATQFSRAGGTIAGELAACQRYFYRLQNGASLAPVGNGTMYTSASGYPQHSLPSIMRAVPTFATSSATGGIFYYLNGNSTTTSIALGAASAKQVEVGFNFAGIAAGTGGAFFMKANEYLDFNAEL